MEIPFDVDPVSLRVTDLIRLALTLNQVSDPAAVKAVKKAMKAMVADIDYMVYPAIQSGEPRNNIMVFPGGRA